MSDLLVLDIGTSGVRAALVSPDAAVVRESHVPVLPSSPSPGHVEFDAAHMADQVLAAAREVLADNPDVAAVGIANQRTSTVVWDRESGEPVAPGQGWQDLRTLGDCLVLNGEGFRISPTQSVTKLANILDTVDPDRERDLCFGTVESWMVWRLTGGRCHVSDISNAALTGMMTSDGTAWDDRILDRLRIPRSVLPNVVDSSGVIGEAVAFDGAPPIAGLAGDQQASLVGQGCVHPGLAKITFGTGGMLDLCIGPRPAFELRGKHGTFPIVCWRRDGETVWGVEAAMLSAGTNIEWLRDDLGIIGSAAESAVVASACQDTGGVLYVPALLGLGTPYWDYGARGTLVGITRGTGKAEVVRAVLEGIAHRGADLVEAAEGDSGMSIPALRVDGGMSANPVFIQALANASGRPVEVSPVREATSLGAAFLAGLAVGVWGGWDELAAMWRPARVVEPETALDRDRWREAVERSRRWHADLSSLDF